MLDEITLKAIYSMTKTFKFKFRDDNEKQTEPSKLKHVFRYEDDECLGMDKIVCEFQVFLEKLGFDYLARDKVDFVKLINDEYRRRYNHRDAKLREDKELAELKHKIGEVYRSSGNLVTEECAEVAQLLKMYEDSSISVEQFGALCLEVMRNVVVKSYIQLSSHFQKKEMNND